MPTGSGVEDLVVANEVLDFTSALADCRDCLADAGEPALGQVFFQAADSVEHVVHAATGGFLHDRLQGFALAEGVEDRGDGA